MCSMQKRVFELPLFLHSLLRTEVVGLLSGLLNHQLSHADAIREGMLQHEK